MKILRIAVFGIILAMNGCSRAPVSSTGNMTAKDQQTLLTDCRAIWSEHLNTQKEVWMKDDPTLPSAVIALKPQIINVSLVNQYPLVDIQISGGFNHKGLMIMPTNAPVSFVPRKSSWKVTKISDNIFEYCE